MQITSSFNRILINRSCLLVPLLLITALVLVQTAAGIFFLLTHINAETFEQLHVREETIAVLLVGFGVFLEGREILAKHVHGVTDFDHMPVEASLNHTCEIFG